MSLKLEHIYGLLLADKRHTIMYLHIFNRSDQDVADRIKLKVMLAENKVMNLSEGAEKKLDLLLPRILGSDYKTLLN